MDPGNTVNSYDNKGFVEFDKAALEKYGLDVIELDIKNKVENVICYPTIEGAEEFDNRDLAPNLNNFDSIGFLAI